MESDPAYEKVLKTKVLPGLEKYRDIKRSPVAYASYINTAAPSDRFYDDNVWLGIDFTDLYMTTGDRKYLEKAEEIWKFIESGIDNRLEGGIYWCEQKKHSKNACSNAPGAVFAAKLYLATENQDYLDMAKGLYLWTKEKLLDTEDWLYMDNINMRGEVNRTKYAYNSGQMVQAGALLYRITGKMEYIEDARKTAKACHEYFFEPFTGKDGKEFRILKKDNIWFHAVMVRGLIELYHMDGNAEYVNDVKKTLDHAWEVSKTPQGLFPTDLSGVLAAHPGSHGRNVRADGCAVSAIVIPDIKRNRLRSDSSRFTFIDYFTLMELSSSSFPSFMTLMISSPKREFCHANHERVKSSGLSL